VTCFLIYPYFRMASSLPTLQNLIRRDPTSYKDDFAVQYEYLKSKISLFFVSPSSELNNEISELIMFVSHVLKCYPLYHEEFPKMLEDLVSLSTLQSYYHVTT